jgi:hypothetical protein
MLLATSRLTSERGPSEELGMALLFVFLKTGGQGRLKIPSAEISC